MKSLFILFMSLSVFTACNSQHSLSKAEVAVQTQADIAVSNILFDAGMDTQASYNVRKNGHVEIEFAKSVPLFDYSNVVNKMRKHSDITSVHAIQSGQVLCPLE